MPAVSSRIPGFMSLVFPGAECFIRLPFIFQRLHFLGSTDNIKSKIPNQIPQLFIRIKIRFAKYVLKAHNSTG